MRGPILFAFHALESSSQVKAMTAHFLVYVITRVVEAVNYCNVMAKVQSGSAPSQLAVEEGTAVRLELEHSTESITNV